MKRNINYSRHFIDKADIKSVTDVLKSDFLTQGKKVNEFENKFSTIVNSKYALAVTNATSGLYLACLALGLKKNDIVWTASNSFVASSNAPKLIGCKIDFIDIDLKTYNISIEDLEKKLIKAKNNNKLPKLIIPVHFAGLPSYQKKIKKLSNEYRFKILEDASHSLGAHHNNDPVGSCKYSDISVFSFHPVKIITTGEGGMITTNSKKIYNQLLILRNHGINRDPNKFLNKNHPKWYYEQISISLNFRMNDIQAALGISQIKKLKKFVKERNRIAKFYNDKLKNENLILPFIPKNFYSSFHLYVIRFKKPDMQKKIYNYLKSNNINVQVHYIPIHTQPFYKKIIKTTNLKNTMIYSQSCLSIPNYYGLNQKQLNLIVSKIMEAIKIYA